MEPFATATIFYATTEELACWLLNWQHCYSLHAVAGRVWPSPGILRELPLGSVAAAAEVVREYETICLGTQQLDSDDEYIKQVVAKNPRSLVVRCPRQSATTLGYGSMSASPTFSESRRVWEAIREDLIRNTQSGAWYRVPGKRKKALEPEVRYSAGAFNLFREGTTLLGGGSTVVVQLGRNEELRSSD